VSERAMVAGISAQFEEAKAEPRLPDSELVAAAVGGRRNGDWASGVSRNHRLPRAASQGKLLGAVQHADDWLLLGLAAVGVRTHQGRIARQTSRSSCRNGAPCGPNLVSVLTFRLTGPVDGDARQARRRSPPAGEVSGRPPWGLHDASA
jgi:hypothetical protein